MHCRLIPKTALNISQNLNKLFSILQENKIIGCLKNIFVYDDEFKIGSEHCIEYSLNIVHVLE